MLRRLPEGGRFDAARPVAAIEVAGGVVAWIRLVVGDDQGGFGEKAIAGGGLGAFGFGGGFVDDAQFALLGGREVGEAAVDEFRSAIAVIPENLEDGDDGATEFGGFEGRGFESDFVGG